MRIDRVKTKIKRRRIKSILRSDFREKEERPFVKILIIKERN